VFRFVGPDPAEAGVFYFEQEGKANPAGSGLLKWRLKCTRDAEWRSAAPRAYGPSRDWGGAWGGAGSAFSNASYANAPGMVARAGGRSDPRAPPPARRLPERAGRATPAAAGAVGARARRTPWRGRRALTRRGFGRSWEERSRFMISVVDETEEPWDGEFAPPTPGPTVAGVSSFSPAMQRAVTASSGAQVVTQPHARRVARGCLRAGAPGGALTRSARPHRALTGALARRSRRRGSPRTSRRSGGACACRARRGAGRAAS
jgi:hypothetical protein